MVYRSGGKSCNKDTLVCDRYEISAFLNFPWLICRLFLGLSDFLRKISEEITSQPDAISTSAIPPLSSMRSYSRQTDSQMRFPSESAKTDLALYCSLLSSIAIYFLCSSIKFTPNRFEEST